MRTITIEVNGDANVRLDGAELVQVATIKETSDDADDSIRHDTPLEVQIAATCHEARRQYNRMAGFPPITRWSEASGPEQATTIELVRAVREGRVKTPADNHAQWMAEKLDQGWVYGPQKSYMEKTHPCLVPYAELSPEQRRKDLLFFTIASALLAPI